ALVAAPITPLAYHALSGGPTKVSISAPIAAADPTHTATVDAPSVAAAPATSYTVLIDGKIKYPGAGVPGQKLRNQKNSDGHIHAMLIVDANPIDLNPTGFTDSWIMANNGTQQIGYGKTADGVEHALLWLGNAQSAVDLNPNGFTSSQGWGVSDTQAVGSGTTPVGANHALLWTGAASSCVDLNPPGFVQSWAIATNGSEQVGLGMTAVNPMPHALVWNGTAKSAVDLQQFLPAGYTMSKALVITDTGEIIGIATDGSYRQHNVEWIPTGGGQ
ncbi:MAG TPA: hypothetical protein VKJ65_09705, partial [Phycisphaerae bacterium]|nr:hypothetical protein [Phycisphaerae bacterium]